MSLRVLELDTAFIQNVDHLLTLRLFGIVLFGAHKQLVLSRDLLQTLRLLLDSVLDLLLNFLQRHFGQISHCVIALLLIRHEQLGQIQIVNL